MNNDRQFSNPAGGDTSEYEAAVFEHARTIFPEIGHGLFSKNFLELAHVYDSVKKCKGCMSKDMCFTGTGGYLPTPAIEKSGSVIIAMAPCCNNPGGRTGGSKRAGKIDD